MRIALLSDVHSNIVALELMMEELKKYDIDEYFFLGDIVTDGNNDKECLDIIREYGNEIILGNREESILEMNIENYKFTNRIDERPLKSTFELLSKEDLDYLSTWDKIKIIERNGYKILLIHGKNPYIGDIKYKDNLDNLIDKYDFDICFYGHTHLVESFSYRGKLFFNPGSVGLPSREQLYSSMIIDINEKIKVLEINVRSQRNFWKLKRNYLNTKYYNDNRIWCNLILLGIYNGKDYIFKFIDYINSNKNDNISNDEYEKLWIDSYNKLLNSIDIKDICKDLI